MNERQRLILTEAISRFGEASQKMMAIEECSELINAVAKETRGRSSRENIITEIADVTIMMAQLAMIYGEEDVMIEINRKIARLESRMNI